MSLVSFHKCVRFENGWKKTKDIESTNIDRIREILNEVDESRNHIVFLDGYVFDGNMHIDVLMTCNYWISESREKRRLVLNCSMSFHGNSGSVEDHMNNVKEFYVYSWKLEEYQKAVENRAFFNSIKNRAFFNSIKDCLDSSCVKVCNRQRNRLDLVNSKFYFAGGSPRHMFH